MKRKLLTFAALLLVLCLLLGCGAMPQQSAPPSDNAAAESENTLLQVHFIDVGQGDGMLITCGDAAMVVDAGIDSKGQVVADYLAAHGIDSLDYIMGTHPHEDHIGGLDTVINSVKIDALLMPDAHSDSMGLQQVLEAAGAQDIQPTYVSPGQVYSLGDAEFTIFGPQQQYSNQNNNSIVMKLIYGDTSFVFTGDMELDSAGDIVECGYDLSADVLKVGHHGSYNSTPYSFLREVMPTYSVIQVGADNDYGHPHQELMSRLNDCRTVILRNDLNGTVVITSDGTQLNVEVEKGEIPQPAEEVQYIGNINSKKLHRPDCSGLPKEQNRVYFDSYELAESEGYTPCSNCMG